MQSGNLVLGSNSIHYLKGGTGNNLLICFHGYGESAAHFSFLIEQLRNPFTIISIDLPYHGETKWATSALDGKKLTAIIHGIVKQENFSLENIYLMGFSL